MRDIRKGGRKGGEIWTGKREIERWADRYKEKNKNKRKKKKGERKGGRYIQTDRVEM